MEDHKFSDPLFLFFDAMLFVITLSVLFLIVRVYSQNEKGVVKSLKTKNTVSTTYNNQEDEEKTEINGTCVINEILIMDDDISIQVNSTVLTNLVTPTGEKYLEYVRKYDKSLLYDQISITNNYIREVKLDREGKVTGITYILVS